MNIIEINLRFGSLTVRQATIRTIEHHSGTTVRQSVERIHEIHVNSNGWSGIGYHFFIRRNGQIFRGRPINMVGAHAGGHNGDSIGICYEGNFEVEDMTPEQIAAGQWLNRHLREIYPTIIRAQVHRDVNATACPRKKLPN